MLCSQEAQSSGLKALSAARAQKQSGLGKCPAAAGDGWRLCFVGSHPTGDGDELGSAVYKTQGLQEQVNHQRGKARRSTHARFSIPPSLTELINLAKIQCTVICLIQ